MGQNASTDGTAPSREVETGPTDSATRELEAPSPAAPSPAAPSPAAPAPPAPAPGAAPAPEKEGDIPKGKKEKTKKEKGGKGEGTSKEGQKGKGEGKGKFKDMGKGKTEKGKGKSKMFEPASGPLASGAGYRLNVKNLGEDVTTEMLVEAFAPFGNVSQAQVKTQDNGKSRCFGFVVLRDEEEGKKAIEGMNGKEIGGRFVIVAPAERRASIDGMEGKGKGKGKQGKEDLLAAQQQAMAAAYMQQYQQYFYLQQLNYFYQQQQQGGANASAAAGSQVEFEGSLKSLSAKNGYGFIVCAETARLYDRDIYVAKELLPEGVKVTDRLKFTVELNDKGHPRASRCSFALATF